MARQLKFEDCATCRFRRIPRICRDCDMGELYEDEDAPGVDSVFREPPATRFGDTVSADDIGRAKTFDPQRFVEDLGEQDDGNTDDEADDDC